MWLVATMLDSTRPSRTHLPPPRLSCQHSFSISKITLINHCIHHRQHPPPRYAIPELESACTALRVRQKTMVWYESDARCEVTPKLTACTTSVLTVHLWGFSPVCRLICTTSIYWALKGFCSLEQSSHRHTNSFFSPWIWSLFICWGLKNRKQEIK